MPTLGVWLPIKATPPPFIYHSHKENIMEKTREEIIAEIEKVKKDIANFYETHGNPLGCSMRSLTLQSMHYHLESLIEQLRNS